MCQHAIHDNSAVGASSKISQNNSFPALTSRATTCYQTSMATLSGPSQSAPLGNKNPSKPHQPGQHLTNPGTNVHVNQASSNALPRNLRHTGMVAGLAPMRPQAWSSSPNTNSIPCSSKPAYAMASSSAHQNGEIPLPKELEFSPETLKPIADENRIDLVENAKVSKPLLNGMYGCDIRV